MQVLIRGPVPLDRAIAIFFDRYSNGSFTVSSYVFNESGSYKFA